MGDRGTSGVRIIVGGGIGAGKSTVLGMLADEGFFVIEADRIGHQILDLETSAGQAIARRWPSVVVDGELSRPRIAEIVFADGSELAVLESITHPAIRTEIERVVDALGGTPIALEVPVMGMMGDGWIRVAVVAPPEIRVERAVERGGDEADVRARMAAQPTDEEWAAWADHVLDNSFAEGVTASSVGELLKTVGS